MAAILPPPLISSKLYLLLSLSSLLLVFPCNTAHNSNPLSNRQALGIGIGIGIGIGGGSSPPPSVPEPEPEPEPECPPPPILLPPTKKSPLPPPSPQKKPTKPVSSPAPRGLTSADFPNLLLYQSYKVIQRFKKTIFSDPMEIKKTWTGPDLSKYRGFFLGETPRFKNITAVASVDFNEFYLGAPTLSGFVDRFPDLALFHANSNKFFGSVPDLTHLPNLYELDLSNNRLSGSFPSNVLPLRNLTFLDLRYNRFTSIVPPATFLLPLDVLFLNNNNFSQPLPANLGRTTAHYLTLANNGFTGKIPASISLANRTLIEVLLLGNQLSGCLPPEIGQLARATVFDAGSNMITGPIPQALGCLRRVEQLNFAGNLLYGKVPEEVCSLGIRGGSGRLLNLSLSGNYFTSLGNSCRSLLQRGVMDVRRNCIPGLAHQRSPAECKRFLAHRKYCPLVSYNIPCYELREDGQGGLSSPAAEDAPARGSGFPSYYALGKRNGL